jgi:hypothetical protein
VVVGDDETQVLNALLLKLTLLRLQVQFVAAKLLENPADYLLDVGGKEVARM